MSKKWYELSAPQKGAVVSRNGWINPKTGELLVSMPSIPQSVVDSINGKITSQPKKQETTEQKVETPTNKSSETSKKTSQKKTPVKRTTTKKTTTRKK